MRETCARVLAAALMTGAIATVVWMSALAGTPDDTLRPLAAPAAPPPLSVTIRAKIRVEPAKARPRPRVRRVQQAPATPSVTAAPTMVTKPLAAAHPRRAKKPTRHLASTSAEPTVTSPAPAPPAPTAPAVEPVDERGNGHAYGHDKARGKGHEKHEQ